MSRWISLIVLLAIIIVTAGLLYRVMAGFLLPLFLAAVLAVIFRPIHSWIFERTKKRQLQLAHGLARLQQPMLPNKPSKKQNRR